MRTLFIFLCVFGGLICGALGTVASQKASELIYRYESDRVGVVSFDHPLHESRVGRCDSCHHEEVPSACSLCHDVEPAVPLRKDVFHKMCKDCHRSRSMSVECADCHKPF